MSISAGESKSTGIPNITELKFEHQDIKKKIQLHNHWIKLMNKHKKNKNWTSEMEQSYNISKKQWSNKTFVESEITKKIIKYQTKLNELEKNKLAIERIIGIKNISISTQIDAGFEKNIKTLLGNKTLEQKADAQLKSTLTYFSLNKKIKFNKNNFEHLFQNVKAGLYNNINKRNNENPECWKKLELNLSRLKLDPGLFQSLIEPLIYKSLVIVIPFVQKIISLNTQLISINKRNFESFPPSTLSQFKTQLDILEIETFNLYKNIEAVNCIWFLQCIISRSPEWINTQKNKKLIIVLMKILGLFHQIIEVGKQIGINKYKIDTILQNRGASAKKIQARIRGRQTRKMMRKPRRKSIHPGNLHPSDTRHPIHNETFGPLANVSSASSAAASSKPSRWDRMKKAAKRAVEIASTKPGAKRTFGGKRKTKRRRRKVTRNKKRRKQKKTRKK